MRLKNLAAASRAACFGVALAAMAGHALADSVSADVSASATLVRTLAVASTTGLSFGTIAPSAAAGTVVIAADGARSATGGATLLSANAGSAGGVSLVGTASLAYTVSMPNTVTLTASGGSATMTLGSLTTNLAAGGGTLNATGNGSFSIGGTLSVGAGQAVASYAGVLPVTITWN
jgi:hypothetical protein